MNDRDLVATPKLNQELRPADQRDVHWVKSVTRTGENLPAYLGRDVNIIWREPRTVGDEFDLHCSNDARDSLDSPDVGDVICLTQWARMTHLLRVTGSAVVKRPARTMRPRKNDRLYPWQRVVEVVAMKDLDTAPTIAKAFGFKVEVQGGLAYEITKLTAFQKSGATLTAVQRSIWQALGE